jgi:1,2-diacylglycerol 3-beta-galactosyltransferase
MSDTGGGHRSAAEAIASAFAREFPGRYAVALADGIARAARFPFSHAADWYLPTVTYAEFGWGALFHSTNNPAMVRLSLRFLDLVMGNGLHCLLRDQAPALVVSVHPLLTTIPRRALRAMGSRAPFITVVTDLFDAHALWFDREADLCLVPTDGARATARRFGMPDEKLRVVGLPVSLQFLANTKSRAEHRAQLGLAPDRTTVLLVGGGEGMGRIYGIARAIAHARLPLQLVVIAGRNKALLRKLQTTTWEIPVSVQAFVTNMPEWMRASDVIITKAGPATLSEALTCGLPILLSGFLPGQEEGNVTFVEKSGVGVLRQSPKEIARTLGDWLAPGNDTLARFAARARELARPRAALEIAAILDAILTSRESRL